MITRPLSASLVSAPPAVSWRLVISRAHLFRKPAVNLTQPLLCLVPLALLLSEARETHGCPQLQQLCLLLTSGLDGVMKTAFCL
jgi:hypothetical protein